MAGKIELHEPAHPTFKDRQKKAAAEKAAVVVETKETKSEPKK